jgi:hypothetical protein
MGRIFSPHTYPNGVNTHRVSGRGYPLPSLPLSQMTSPTPTNGGDTRFSFDYLSHDGFPSILWEVLCFTGYPTPPLYTVQLYEEHRVPRGFG